MNGEPLPRVALAGLATVDRSWQGRVHSRFDRAVNVSVGSTLHTLIDNPLWISEKNIVVPAEALTMAGPSSIVRFDRRRLHIDGVAVGRYDGTSVWRMPRWSFSPPVNLAFLGRRLEQAPADGLSQYVEREFVRAAGALLHGREADFSRLVGAGRGLTPGGDDMLVGLALALLYAAPNRLRELAEACGPLLSRTTDLSRHFLREALAGRFSAPLVNLLAALQKNEGLEAAFETAWDIGDSSGRDGIRGLYYGLGFFCGECEAASIPAW